MTLNLLRLCLVSASVTTAATVEVQAPFADVPPSHWASEEVEIIARLGFIEGRPNGTFGGEEATTRYEMAAVMARLVKFLDLAPVASADSRPRDVPQTHWAREAINATNARQLFSVAASKNFHGSRALTRYEFAVVVQRLIGAKSPGSGAGTSEYRDVPREHWAADAVDHISSSGLIEGFPDGNFHGDAPILRYHFARVLVDLSRRRGHKIVLPASNGDATPSVPDPAL